jgi:hypothetical protein
MASPGCSITFPLGNDALRDEKCITAQAAAAIGGLLRKNFRPKPGAIKERLLLALLRLQATDLIRPLALAAAPLPALLLLTGRLPITANLVRSLALPARTLAALVLI